MVGLRKIVGWLFWAVGCLFGLAKFVADWIGRSTLSEDAEALREKLAPMLEFLERQPDIWFYGFQAFLGIAGLAIVFAPTIWRVALRRVQTDSAKDGPLPLDVVTQQFSLPINEPSLSAYIRSSKRLRSLETAIAHDLSQEVQRDPPPTHVYEEEARALGIKTIGELDNLLQKHGSEALRMAHYFPVSGTKHPSGYGLEYLFMVLGARLGADRFYEVYSKLTWVSMTRGGVERYVEAYDQIKASSSTRSV
jgi:hypothetical protein